MAKTKPETGLSLDQIDAITLELCHAEALSKALHAELRGDTNARSFFMLLDKQLSTVKEMVCDCQIGGRS